jgi:hypothetical protein
MSALPKKKLPPTNVVLHFPSLSPRKSETVGFADIDSDVLAGRGQMGPAGL